MISAALMNGLAHLIRVVQLFFDDGIGVTYYVDLIVRFGDLGLILGCVAIVTVLKSKMMVRVLASVFAAVGALRFLLIEFSVFPNHSFISVILLIVQLAAFVLFFRAMANDELPVMTIKSKITNACVIAYGVSFALLSLIQVSAYPTLEWISTIILSLFYVLYQWGIYLYFKEWYREAYTYRNPYLMEI